MNVDDIELGDVDEMSDDEIIYWFAAVQKAEQTKRMRQELKNYLDMRDANENPRTIKIVDSKVIS